MMLTDIDCIDSVNYYTASLSLHGWHLTLDVVCPMYLEVLHLKDYFMTVYDDFNTCTCSS